MSYFDLKERLARSGFRSRFRLGQKEKSYVAEKGMELIFEQAKKILRSRLGEAWPVNDGKQTPMRGHAVFIAQHAVGCCCRGCLEKWHFIPRGRPLTEEEISYLASVITGWIGEQCASGEGIIFTPDLFG